MISLQPSLLLDVSYVCSWVGIFNLFKKFSKQIKQVGSWGFTCNNAPPPQMHLQVIFNVLLVLFTPDVTLNNHSHWVIFHVITSSQERKNQKYFESGL